MAVISPQEQPRVTVQVPVPTPVQSTNYAPAFQPPPQQQVAQQTQVMPNAAYQQAFAPQPQPQPMPVQTAPQPAPQQPQEEDYFTPKKYSGPVAFIFPHTAAKRPRYRPRKMSREEEGVPNPKGLSQAVAASMESGRGVRKDFIHLPAKEGQLPEIAAGIAYRKTTSGPFAGWYRINRLGSTGQIKGAGTELLMRVVKKAVRNKTGIHFFAVPGSESYYQKLGFKDLGNGDMGADHHVAAGILSGHTKPKQMQRLAEAVKRLACGKRPVRKSMSDMAAFHDGMTANDQGELPSLVYADWLDEHDKPMAARAIRAHNDINNAPFFTREENVDPPGSFRAGITQNIQSPGFWVALRHQHADPSTPTSFVWHAPHNYFDGMTKDEVADAFEAEGATVNRTWKKKKGGVA